MLRPRAKKLIQKERELLLQGKGAVESAKKQLYAEEAEQHYQSIKNTKPRTKYRPSTEEQIGKWASRTAEMIYNRKKKRGKV